MLLYKRDPKELSDFLPLCKGHNPPPHKGLIYEPESGFSPETASINDLILNFFLFFFKFYFIFKLYIIVLVLPNIKMNPSQGS